MLKLPVYLYANVTPVILDLDHNQRINNIMYQRELQIQKGVQNTFQFQFQNSDQKPIDVSTSSFVFVMVNATNQQLVLEKQVEIIDDGLTRNFKGLAQVTLIESDTQDLQESAYTFGLKVLNPDGNTYSPTYSNTYYGAGGVVKLKQDIYPVAKPSYEIPLSTKISNGDPSHNMYDFWGGPSFADPQLKSNSGLYTVAFYLNNFAGTYSVEGCLDNQPAQLGNANANFATITSGTITTNTTGVVYVNFNGVYSYLRFKSTPAPDQYATNWYSQAQLNPTTPTQFPNGKIDKVLLRT